MTQQLWSDLGGRVACTKHLGRYATAALEAEPTLTGIWTPITVWEQLPLDEVDFYPCEDCGEGVSA